MGTETFLAWVPWGWLLVFVVCWGMIWGSFANVVIARLPRHESIVLPASHCLACQTPIRWYDNIPVLSWLLLRGRCRACGEPISWQYPLVELGGCLCALAAAWLVGGGSSMWRVQETPSWEVLSAWLLVFYFFLLLWMLFWTDIRALVLPHALTIALVAGALVYGVVIPPGGDWRGFVFAHNVWDAMLGFVVGYGGLYLFALLYALVRNRQGMGGGDFMLLGALAAWLGWESLPVLLLLSAVQGVVAAGVSIVFFPTWMREVADDDEAFWAAEPPAEEQVERTAGESLMAGSSTEDTAPAAASARGIPFGPFLVLAAIEYAFLGGLYQQWLNGGFG